MFFLRIPYFTGLLLNFVFTAALCSELRLVYVLFNIMYMDFYMLRVVLLIYIYIHDLCMDAIYSNILHVMV